MAKAGPGQAPAVVAVVAVAEALLWGGDVWCWRRWCGFTGNRAVLYGVGLVRCCLEQSSGNALPHFGGLRVLWFQ